MSDTPPPLPTKQKLVTIYLDSLAYQGKGSFTKELTKKHGSVEEHLNEYLEAGWKIMNIVSLEGHSESYTTRGWIVVTLELTPVAIARPI